jgi:hypothetical protein
LLRSGAAFSPVSKARWFRFVCLLLPGAALRGRCPRPAVFRVLWLSPYVRIFRFAPAGRFFESCGSRLMSGFSLRVAQAGRFSVPVALALCPGFPRRAGRPFFEPCGSRLMSGFSCSRRPAGFRFAWLSPYVRIFWVAPAGRFSLPVALALCPDFPGREGRPFSLPVALAVCPDFSDRAGRPIFASCGSRLMSGFPGRAGRPFFDSVALAVRPEAPARPGRPLCGGRDFPPRLSACKSRALPPLFKQPGSVCLLAPPGPRAPAVAPARGPAGPVRQGWQFWADRARQRRGGDASEPKRVQVIIWVVPGWELRRHTGNKVML